MVQLLVAWIGGGAVPVLIGLCRPIADPDYRLNDIVDMSKVPSAAAVTKQLDGLIGWAHQPVSL